MVEIFKTNIINGAQAGLALQLLIKQWPEYGINFDLEDCDKILRVESDFIENEKIIAFMKRHGHFCETLN
jgi:3-methyladenine DNA glycosylase Tag